MNQNHTTSKSSSGSSNRGFAAMDPEEQRAIASEGGRAAHAKGTAHEFTSEEAAEAGRKGGQARARNSQARQNQLLNQTANREESNRDN